MELIYLWTNKYKNLEGGYELSTKYKVSTTIKEKSVSDIYLKTKEKYIDAFFDKKNKINITAIIGENGSGKSSIMKLIIQLLYTNFNSKSNTKFGLEESFLIFSIENNFYYIASNVNMIQPNLSVNNKNKFFTQYSSNFYTLYFNYMLDSLKDSTDETWIDNIYHKSDDYTMPILLEPYKKNNNIDINNLNYLTRQRMILHRDSFRENQFLKNIFDPEKVRVSVDTDKLLKIFKSTPDGKYKNSIKQVYKKEFSTLNELLNKIEQEERNIESIKKRFKDNIKEREKLEENSKNNILDLQNKINEIILNNIPFYVLNNLYIANKIDKYHKHQTSLNIKGGVDRYSFDKNQNKIDIWIDDQSHNTLKLRNAIQYQNDILNNKDITSKERENFIPINDSRLKYLPSWFEVSFYDKNGRTFTTLSAGEKSFYILLTTLVYQIKNIDSRKNLPQGTYNSLLILLDEADLGLHPKWQRQYLYNIVETLKESSYNLNYHVVCTSHSPFIVSDLPKDNIVFLNKGKIDYLKDNEYTFGENIHTLLNDSFFMQKDMMMGKIAEYKLRECFDFFEEVFDHEKQIEKIYNNETGKEIEKETLEIKEKKLNELKQAKEMLKIKYQKNCKYYQGLQNIIGEEYLQIAFQNSLEECNKLFNINNNLSDRDKLIKALEKDPDLVAKWIKDIE